MDFLQYQHEEEPSYLAFVLDGESCQPKRVELGPAHAIEEAISEWRETLNYQHALTRRIDQRGRKLSALIWEPLLPWIGASESLLIVPDGPIASLPFASRFMLFTPRNT